MNRISQMGASVEKSKDFVLLLFILYITPLCVYLQSLFFATSNAWAAVYILVLTGLMLNSKSFLFQVKKTDACFFAFMLIACFSSLIVGEYLYFMQVFLVIMFVWGYTRYDLRNLYKCLDIVVVFGVACAVACIIQEVWNGFYVNFVSKLFKAQEVETIFRLEENMGHCGLMPQTGTAAVCILNAFFILMLKNSNFSRKLIYGVILLVGLLMTGKRAHLFMGMFVFFISFFVGFDEKRKMSKYLKGVIAAIILVGGIITVAPFLPQDSSIVKGLNTIRGFDINDDEVMHGRELLYAEAIDMGNSAPLTGHGWGSFKRSVSYRGGNTDAHNVFLQLYAEMGIIVAVFFLLSAIFLLRHNVKLLKEVRFKHSENSMAVSLTRLSFCFHLFFFLYCLTGNALYNVECLIVFGLGISILKRVNQKVRV